MKSHVVQGNTRWTHCVEISQTTSRLDRKQRWLHACAAGPAWSRFTKVGWASRWQIRKSHFKWLRFRHFRHNRNTKSDSDRLSYRPVNCICTKKYTVYSGSFLAVFFLFAAVFRLLLKRVWRDIRDSCNGGHCLLTVGGRLRGVKIGAECVKYAWLSCPVRPSRWVLCISMQWLRLKGCHVACDECASGETCSHQHMWVTGLSYGPAK